MNVKPLSVFDASVLVSAVLFKNSVPRLALKLALRQGILLLSPEVIQEVRDVLDRDKFDRYVSREDRHEFLEELAAQARLVEVTERLHVCRDPKDDMYLELEVSGNADVIVSGDEDLLVLHPSRASLF